VAAVNIDAAQDTYTPPGAKERALKGSALLRLAAAAGITWVPQQSGRIDDGSDPLYARYRATGVVKDADGTARLESREKEIDLRPTSPTRENMRRQAEARVAKARSENRSSGTAEAELKKAVEQAAEHIAAMAESKSKNRVIRALLGVKATMTDTELSRPFVALKPVFTGEFNDAELNREVALMLTAHEAGMDVAQLFGRRAIGQHQIDLRGPAQLSPPTESTARRISPEDAAAMADALDAEHEEEPSQAGRQQAAPEPAPTVRFEDLDDESQASALIKLAKQKGKLGNEKDQISADWIRKQPPIRRVAVREKLIPLPDDTDTDDLPPFMR
jgi:histone H3/H4